MEPKTLYAHQQRFIDKNPNRALLVWETGTGKTVAACLWLAKRAHVKALVVCPKAIVGKWKRDLVEWGVVADVCSRDDVKKIDLNKYDALVLDEAQDFASPLFTGGRSQRATVLYNYIKGHKEAHVLLLTATPVRSTPYNIHTLGCYLGHYWPIKDFRDKFFYFTNQFGRLHWEKKSGWQKMIRPYVEEISDIVLMKDCIDVPEQHSQVQRIEWTKEQEASMSTQYQEPTAIWHERHRLENGKEKFNVLKDIIDGYRKVIVVCHYRSQIDEYAKWIGEERQVFVLHGGVNNQDDVIKEAREADDAVFIIQASMGAGFDAAEFSVVVFASMDFKYISMVQMKGRVKRINDLHENNFIYLLGGKCDEAVYKTLMAGKDFDPIAYFEKEGRPN